MNPLATLEVGSTAVQHTLLICSSVDHLEHHKMQALPLHFKWIICIFTANGAEENNIKYEQSNISGQQSPVQNEV
jgi:hypothetical protein